MDGAYPDRKKRIDGVLNKLQTYIDTPNIATMLDETKLSEIGTAVVNEFDIDLRSRSDWEETAKRAMDIALQVREKKNWPFPNASNVKWPLVTVAALQFNARAYPAIVDADRIVKAKVIGADPGGQKRGKADRISEHMSYQLSEEMEEWEGETDTLFMQLPIVGDAHRKVYYDKVAKRNRSEMIPSIDLIINQAVRTLEEAPRITHRLRFYPHQIEERQRSKLWLEEDFGTAPSGEGDTSAPHEFLEQHRLIDLDEDGYEEPYIVTVHKQTSKVVRIVANYGADDVQHEENEITSISRRDYFVHFVFIPDPKGGYYGIGFGSLLEGLGAAIDTTINQMLDAGTLQNAGGGFIGSGVRLKKGHVRMEPGVYKTIDASGTKLREAIYNMEHPGPSAVLFNLLGLMIDAAKDITAVQDIMTGDSGEKNQTATTTLALIEQGMKVFTAIYKRIYRALKREFKLLYRLNSENLDDQAYFTVLDTEKAISKNDYEMDAYDVCPVADPRVVTDMQKAARAQVLMTFLNDPLTNQIELRRRVFVATGQEDVENLLVQKPPAPDPMVVAGAEAEIARNNAAAQKDGAQALATVAGIEQEDAKIEQKNAELELQAAALVDQVTKPEPKAKEAA